MDPLSLILLQAGLGLGSSAIGGLMGRAKQRPTEMQQNQQNQINQILAGLEGQGPYASMFSADRESFDQQFGEPAREQFRTQTTPAIQQGYIASGQQRGTGMEDSLTRAGVNMDTILNQQYGQYQQGAEQNRIAGINAILGGGAGLPNQQSYGQAAQQGAAGFLSGPDFQQNIGQLIQSLLGQNTSNQGRDQNLSQYFRAN